MNLVNFYNICKSRLFKQQIFSLIFQHKVLSIMPSYGSCPCYYKLQSIGKTTSLTYEDLYFLTSVLSPEWAPFSSCPDITLPQLPPLCHCCSYYKGRQLDPKHSQSNLSSVAIIPPKQQHLDYYKICYKIVVNFFPHNNSISNASEKEFVKTSSFLNMLLKFLGKTRSTHQMHFLVNVQKLLNCLPK